MEFFRCIEVVCFSESLIKGYNLGCHPRIFVHTCVYMPHLELWHALGVCPLEQNPEMHVHVTLHVHA